LLFSKGKPGVTAQSATEIAVETIALNPHQPRQNFDQARMEDLAASIREHGLIQPIVVRPVGNAFELVVGERRLRAARLAGLKKIPAVVRDVTPQEMAVLALIENLQREDLSVIEEARGFRRLLDEFKLTQVEVGRLAGKGQSTIANKLRLLRLSEAVQNRILSDGVSERHARALLDLPDEGWQMRLLDEVRDRELSVRETEERVRSLMAGGEAAPGLSGSGQGVLFEWAGGGGSGRDRPSGRRGGVLGQVSDRRAIRAFRDIRLFLNTFRRAVEMLKEAGVRAELIENDGPDFLEVKVVIPKAGGTNSHMTAEVRKPGGPTTGMATARKKRSKAKRSPERGD
jgi:ParB family chromosome partitioning protein